MTPHPEILRLSSVPSRRIDLHVAPPYPDESLSSCIDRVASLWGITRQALLRDLVLKVSMRDFDCGRPFALVSALAQAFGVSRDELDRRHARNRDVLVIRRRTAYCPLCLVEDLEAGREPYFRLDWARYLLTHCVRHGVPLFEWRDVTSDRRTFPHAWFLGAADTALRPPWFEADLRVAEGYASAALPHEPTDRSMWDALMRFEQELTKRSIGDPRNVRIGGSSFPSETTIRDVLMLLTYPKDGDVARSIAAVTPLAFADRSVVSFDARRMRFRGYGSWNCLRSEVFALPSRRHLLLLAAHTLDVLGVPLVLKDDVLAAPGHSSAWRDRLARLCGSVEFAERALAGRPESDLRAFGRLIAQLPPNAS